MNIYLDIDGVILANDKEIARFADEFLEYIINNHTVYWLTTHCHGDAQYTVILIRRFFQPKTMKLLEKIIPTDWDTNKTEAIDFSKPFLWIEDDLLDEEKEELRKRNVFNSWIEVNLGRDPDQLQKIVEQIKKSVL